jgi:hypothetical protein
MTPKITTVLHDIDGFLSTFVKENRDKGKTVREIVSEMSKDDIDKNLLVALSLLQRVSISRESILKD